MNMKMGEYEMNVSMSLIMNPREGMSVSVSIIIVTVMCVNMISGNW